MITLVKSSASGKTEAQREFRELEKIWSEGWKPPDRRPPWLWAEDNIPNISYSPIPGRFRSDNSPMIREPLEAIVDPKVRLVSISASIQSCKTSTGEIALSYIIPNLPGPTLWLDQTDEDAKDQAESRLRKLFDEIEPVRAQFPSNRHKMRNTTMHFRNGMTLWCLGAHNKTNLQRRSIRWLFGDETWRWPSGHMAEAEARVTAFGWLGKCVFMSQGGEEGDDTDLKHQTTDMREWCFQCPACGKRQAFEWANVQWSADARDDNFQWDFERVKATCEMRCSNDACTKVFQDSDKTRRELNASAVYVAQNPNAAKENVGFHWNSLATMSWGRLAELYLRSKAIARRGELTQLKQFYQKRLALPWREFLEDYRLEVMTSGYKKGEPWEESAAIDLGGKFCDPFTTPPEKIRFRLVLMTVDVQLDHYFLVVRAWNLAGSSRLLWVERVHTLADVDAIQAKFSIFKQLVFMDAGHAPYDVYRECAKRGWTALIGDKRATFPHRTKSGKAIQRFYSTRRRVQIGQLACAVHYFSTLNVKDSLARLRRNQVADESGAPTWQVYDDPGNEYLASMESEHRVKDKNFWIWKQIGNRPNHIWDCEVMQIAAATMLKLVGRESAEAEETDDDALPVAA